MGCGGDWRLFMKVARFDVAKEVAIDIGADMGGFCPYGYP
jgi:predicted rRNA methylase YqxC with S4 and FtsJ domains